MARPAEQRHQQAATTALATPNIISQLPGDARPSPFSPPGVVASCHTTAAAYSRIHHSSQPRSGRRVLSHRLGLTLGGTVSYLLRRGC
jgi:hypothetical protein